MRFFTPQWHAGELTDEECDAVQRDYQEHLRRIGPLLPTNIRILAFEQNLHDALIRRVVYDRYSGVLGLALRAGDLQSGYVDVDLTYHGASLSETDRVALVDAARNPSTEVLYDEVDAVRRDLFAHRILFWPYRETEIRFEGLDIGVLPALGRNLYLPAGPPETAGDDRYLEITGDAR